MRLFPLLLLMAFSALSKPDSASGQTSDSTSTPSADSPVVVKFAIQEEIGPSALRKTREAFNLVKENDADYVLLHLNTYGGRVLEADSIRSRMLNSPVPVYAFVDPNAASAGALIAISCTKIYMSKSATMGAATVVNQEGKKMPEKYQSYMRGTMRATAQSRNRDPKIAEAMVDEAITVEGIAPEGKLLTFTRPEALEYNYCDGKAESIQEVLKKENLQSAQIVQYEATWLDQLITFFINPAVSSFLIMIMLGGLYFELQSPGIGFPIAASILAAILYFIPLYAEAMAANWEILLFIAGLVLIALELFVIPGFGVAGISGLGIILISLILSLLRNDFFDFHLTGGEDVMRAMVTVFSALIIGFIVVLFTGKSFIRSGFFQRLVLQDTLNKQHLPEEHQSDLVAETKSEKVELVGAEGKAYTDLYPSGKVMIGDEMYDAITEGEFIEQSTQVRVLKDLKNKLVVRAIE